MAVLPDHTIMREMRAGRLGIDGFDEKGLTPNGYDLRIAEVSVNGERAEFGSVDVPPGSMLHISTVEYVRLPKDICAQLWMRSSWMRKGIIAGFGKVDAGFEGTLTFAAFNVSSGPVQIPIGERFAQIVFERMESPVEEAYASRSGNYQGQRGITLESVKRP